MSDPLKEGPPRGAEQMVEQIGRVGSFAPGSYNCICVSCEKMFIGDKRAMQCLPCVVKALADKIEELQEALYQADEGTNFQHLYDETKYI